VLATGGYASTVVPFTETIEEVDDMLTLKGLRLIHDRNTPTAPAD
jgi:type III pantothenate kinase